MVEGRQEGSEERKVAKEGRGRRNEGGKGKMVEGRHEGSDERKVAKEGRKDETTEGNVG
jgi:hypothetical protein